MAPPPPAATAAKEEEEEEEGIAGEAGGFSWSRQGWPGGMGWRGARGGMVIPGK